MEEDKDKEIKAIQTRYKDHRFRSRTEARWAVFFDHLQIPWEYEKEGFDLGDGIRYLPDFWLPVQEIWIEIKGGLICDEDEEKARRLRHQSGHAVAIFYGSPGSEDRIIYCWDIGDSSGGSSDWLIESLASSPKERLIFCIEYATSKTLFSDKLFSRKLGTLISNGVHAVDSDTGIGWEIPREYLVGGAYAAAKSARFEFGESGPG